MFSCYLVFFVVLAAFDSFTSLSYVPLILVDLLRNLICIDWLTRAWGAYFMWLLAACQVSLAASAFLILAATFERLTQIWQMSIRHTVQRNRGPIAVGAVFAGLVAYAPSVFELKVLHRVTLVFVITVTRERH